MKRWLLLSMLLLMFLSFSNKDIYAQENIKVFLNDQQIEFEVLPYTKNDRLLVPFRAVVEAFGIKVDWDEELQLITAIKSTTLIYIKIGAHYAVVNNESISLDVSPEIVNGRAFVPLRFISENLGAEVIWDNSTRSVFITYLNNIYKFGELVKYHDMELSVDDITVQSTGIIEIIGKASFDDGSFIIEMADDEGFILPSEILIIETVERMNVFKAALELPTCHYFDARYIVIKVLNNQKNWIKVAEYHLGQL